MKKTFSLIPLMKKTAPVLLVSAFLLPQPARAEIKAGSVELSPFAGFNFFQNRQNLENSPVFGGRIGYNFTERFGVEATGEYIRSEVDDKYKSFARQGQFTSPIDGVDIVMYHLDLMYHFMPQARFNPFVTAGYGAVHNSPKINNKNLSAVDFGVGAKYWVAENVALRVDVRDNMILDETLHNLQTSLGVVFRFGGNGKSAAAPAAAVEPAAAPAADGDSDGDGVSDSRDRCPNTPAGVSVGKDGCPADADRDSVADYLDKCPETPAGVFVDKDGCPLDSDRDGVADYLDRCAATPAGVLVDKDGCPLDSDRDGVADYLDKCPDTPAGVVVDKNGCPPVVTLVPVQKMQENAVVAAEPEVVLSFEDIHFEFDQSTLTPEAKAILDRNIVLLKENPKAKIRIAGFTSAAGTEEYNQKLSERRAESVRTYLVGQGVIREARLKTIGYGETRPLVNEPTPTDLHSDAAKANIRVLFEITVQ